MQLPVLKSFQINTLLYLLLRLTIVIPANSFSRFTPRRTSMSSSLQYQVDVDATKNAWIHQSPFLCSTTTTTTSTEAAADAVATTALIILNAPIQTPPSPVFCRLWEKSAFRVCADGGANRLYHATVSSSKNSDHNHNDDDDEHNNKNKYFLPSLITGDLDSLKEHVRAYYEKHNVPIVRVHDQDRNDLDKSLEAVLEASSSIIPTASSTTATGDGDDIKDTISSPSRKKHYDTCFIYGAFGGRFDQEMASIQALFKYAKRSDSAGKNNDAQQQHLQNLWLYDDHNVAILLQPNQKHVLQFPNYDDDHTDSGSDDNNEEQLRDNNFVLGEGPTCGLIPLGFACDKVTTTGLKWDLNTNTLSFGGLVSTSNRMVSDKVTVECTSHPLLFTAEIIKNTNAMRNDSKSGSKNDVKEEGW